MDVILLMVLTFAGYIVAYHTYGRFLAKRIFRLRPEATTPACEQEDGLDYVPTKKGIIFGHHYTSIAGTGPIVGPAIGIIWGWVPAMIWVFVGSIVMGAVHDFGALVLSLRNEGKSISEIAARFLGGRVRYIFFLVVFLELLIVIAIFGLVIAVVFKMFPASVFPVWMEIPIALALGTMIYKRGVSTTYGTLVAVIAMYITVVMGHYLPIELKAVGGLPATGAWTIILLIYAFIASTLPVHRLLQPRDYINAWELFVAMGLLILGVLAAGMRGQLSIVAPGFNPTPDGAPPMWPFIFITIACGAVSGFHCLVASGTTSKQVGKESDALLVGYGSMLAEAALATLVIIAVAAGIGMAYVTTDGVTLTGTAAWQQHYSSWTASAGLGSKINAMVIGSANMMQALFIPRALGIVIMGVFIASFAGTTLDTATRIQRYVVTELASDMKFRLMTNRYAATAFAVLTAAALAFATGANGKGALTLWPMFGAINQLLAALALLVITNYLRRKGGYLFLVSGIPCAFMIAMTGWAVVLNQKRFIDSGNGLLMVINGAVLLLALWIIVEGVISLAAGAKRPATDNGGTSRTDAQGRGPQS